MREILLQILEQIRQLCNCRCEKTLEIVEEEGPEFNE